MKSKKLEETFIKREDVNVINMIYRAWLETEAWEDTKMKNDAYEKLLKALDVKHADSFKKFVELLADCYTKREVHLICFVLDVVKQINNLPKCGEN